MKTFDKFIPEWLHKKVFDQLLNPQLDWHFPSFGGMATDIKAVLQNNRLIY